MLGEKKNNNNKKKARMKEQGYRDSELNFKMAPWGREQEQPNNIKRKGVEMETYCLH